MNEDLREEICDVLQEVAMFGWESSQDRDAFLDQIEVAMVKHGDQLLRDFQDAAGDLLVELPRPGTEAAKLLAANMVLKNQLRGLNELNNSNSQALDSVLEKVKKDRPILEAWQTLKRLCQHTLGNVDIKHDDRNGSATWIVGTDQSYVEELTLEEAITKAQEAYGK